MPRTPWYRSCFTEHPSFATRDAAAFSGTKRTHDKVKVWCRKCLDKHVEDVMDVELSNFLFHQSDVLHERDEILRECTSFRDRIVLHDILMPCCRLGHRKRGLDAMPNRSLSRPSARL